MSPLLIDLKKYSDIVFYENQKTDFTVVDLSKCFILCDKIELTIVLNDSYMVVFDDLDKMLEFFEDINFILIYFGLIKEENSFSQLIEEIKSLKKNSK